MKIQIDKEKLVLLPLDKLNPNPKNRNKHSDEQIERLADLIRYQGFRQPIIVSNRSGLIVVGHGRLEAAKRLGLPHVPVLFQDFESEEQEYAFCVSDNAIAAWAELDLSGINADLPDLGPDFEIDLLGIKNFEIDLLPPEPQCDEDEVPEAPPEPRTKRGDIYELGRHRLMCGDSTAIDDVEKLMNGEKAAVWASDPPYGISYVDGVANEKGQAKGYKPIANDELQDEALKDFIYQVIVTSLPFMKDGFAFYMWHAMKMQAYFSQAAAAAAAGILFHRQIIWVKPQFVFGRGQYHWRHELCLMGWLQGNEPPFYGEKNQSTVWEIGRENDKIHPTQKPVAIWEPSILNHTKQGEIVYEPFCGSGSNLIACEKNARRCFAVEIEPAYCDVIVSRYLKYTGQTKVIRNGEEIIWDG